MRVFSTYFKHWENSLFWGIIAAHVALIWSFAYFPTTDGPSHIGNAATLRRLLTGECPIAADFFHLTPSPVPNWISYIYAGFLTVFFSGGVTEKIILSTYAVLFPFAFRRVIEKMAPANVMLSILILPLVYNFFFYLGNYNFLLSTTLCLLLLPFLIKHHTISSPKIFAYYTLIFLALYFSHIMGLLLCCSLLCTLLLRELAFTKDCVHFLKQGVLFLLALAPCVMCFFLYVIESKEMLQGVSPIPKWQGLIAPQFQLIFTAKEIYPLILIILIYWLLTAACLRRQSIASMGTLFFAHGIFLLAGTFIAPSAVSGGWLIEERLQWYGFISITLGMALSSFSPLEKKGLAVFATIAALTLTSLRVQDVQQNAKTVADVIGAYSHINGTATVLGINLNSSIIDYKTGYERKHFGLPDTLGYGMADQRCVVSVANFHAAESNTFPLSYVDAVHPYHHLGTFRSVYALWASPPMIDISRYEQKTGKKIDYIILQGNPEYLFQYKREEMWDSKQLYDNVMRQLDALYTLEYTSPSGFVKLYKRKA